MSRARTFLAFDLGAGSGRAILGTLRNGLLSVAELHRFPNEPVSYAGGLHWDVARLWLEIRRGLEAASRAGTIDAIGVDTWGVDYALLGERGALLENPYHYRDARTDGMMELALEIAGRDSLYETTGVQFMPINTLYQLMAAARTMPKLLECAEALVTVPDLFNFWLTGRIACEYTNATTTQCFDWRTGKWACGLLRTLSVPTHFFGEIVQPGTPLGPLLPSFGCGPVAVIAPACHDTGSAVAAVCASGSTAFLSSGTWSLLGTEMPAPVVTAEAQRLNFTNEGGVGGTTRLLKNITGMWILEGCRSSFPEVASYEELIAAAVEAPPLAHLIDPDAPCFARPPRMTEAIREYCASTDQPAPVTPGAFARAVLESLALKYRYVLEQLESLTGARFEQIRIIGGGARNDVLNQFTADATGRRVLAGPAEATALGNIVMQMVGSGAIGSIAEGREIVERSFPPRVFEPRPAAAWDAAWTRFERYCAVTID